MGYSEVTIQSNKRIKIQHNEIINNSKIIIIVMENESDWMMLFEHSLDPTMWYLPFLVQTFCWVFSGKASLEKVCESNHNVD